MFWRSSIQRGTLSIKVFHELVHHLLIFAIDASSRYHILVLYIIFEKYFAVEVDIYGPMIRIKGSAIEGKVAGFLDCCCYLS